MARGSGRLHPGAVKGRSPRRCLLYKALNTRQAPVNVGDCPPDPALATAPVPQMNRAFFLLFLAVSIAAPALAQEQQRFVVAGHVVDGADGSPLPGVTAVLRPAADTSATAAAGITGADGAFALRLRTPGSYLLRLSFVGMAAAEQTVSVSGARTDVGTVALHASVTGLDEVVVEDVQERFRMKGDTTVFNADAFKVNQNASAEDLVGKMPGVVVQDGQVQAQGEQVQRVTVDGREFFGSDPTVALKNLPADVIQSVEVFDRQSDQAQFTGFNDGNTEKTINIITRTGMSNGQFGKLYGGFGEDERYIAGGNANIFDGDRRISIIGLANNVNQQNFAFEDLLGLTGDTGGRMRGGPRGGGGGRGGRGGPGGGSFNPRDFLVGQQGGLSTTTSLGMNYSDKWGSKLTLSGSYFFNRMGNADEALLDRQYILPGEESQFYGSTSQTSSTNFNHRLNARLEYQFDARNSLLIRPNFSFQDNSATVLQSGQTLLGSGALLNESLTDYVSDNGGFSGSTDMLFRHRFGKQGRTVSANLELGLNSRRGDADQNSLTSVYDDQAAGQETTFDQQIDNENAGRSVELDVDYTEPFGEGNQLRLSYAPSYGQNVSDRFAYVQDLTTGRYSILDPAYSNQFDNDIIRQRGGVTLQRRVEDGYNISIGAEVQNERLIGDQTYPVAFDLDRSFTTILPQARLGYDFGDAGDLRVFYRTSTNTPSVSQLQNVVDATNPLLLTSGNPGLKPSYSHSINARFRRGDWRAGRMLFGFIDVNLQRNAIGTASFLATQDTVVAGGVLLPRGSQFSYPVNLKDRSLTARTFFGIGTPLALIKSNLNLRGGLTYSRTPGLVNGQVNLADQYSFNAGLTIGSNISEKVDFTISYGADYTTASNSFYTALDENYFRHDAGLRLSWQPVGGLVVESSATYNDYLGLDEETYPTTLLLNAGLGYRFLQQDAAELKLVVGDLLNQETGIRRTITETYVQDSRSNVLGRYVLLNLSYRFRNFGR